MIKVGIIGAGQVARRRHIPAFRSYEKELEVVAICGREEAKTAAVAKEIQVAKAYTNVSKMLSENSLDLVSVCSPNNLHYTHVMQSLAAGCHVLCEKPPAIAANEALAMAKKSREVNRLLGYNFCNRQRREIEILQEEIEKGTFGKIYHIKATFLRRRGIPGWGSFTKKEVQGGGALIDIGVHALDLALFLLRYPAVHSVLGSTYDHIGKAGGFGLMGSWDPTAFTVEDACFAQLVFNNGSSITLETSFALNIEATKVFNLEVYGSKMGARLQPLQFFTASDCELIDIDRSVNEEVNVQEKNIHQFIGSCFGKPSVVCTADEGAKLQGVVEMIYRSAEEGKAVYAE